MSDTPGFSVAEEVFAFCESMKNRPANEHSREIEIWREAKSRLHPRSKAEIQSAATTMQICGIETVSENYTPPTSNPETKPIHGGEQSPPQWVIYLLAGAVLPILLTLYWAGIHWKVIVVMSSSAVGLLAYQILPGWIANFWPRMAAATGLGGCFTPLLSFGAKVVVSVQNDNNQVVQHQTFVASIITNVAEASWQTTATTSICGCALTFMGLYFMKHARTS